MQTSACVTRHFLLASKMTKASSFFRNCLFVFGRQMIYRQRINAGPWNMSCTKVGLFKVPILFETLYYTRYQEQAKIRVSIIMCMHIFIIIILVNKFVIYLTHDEDNKVIHYAIYFASLTHACYIVLFCHSPGARD